MLGWGGPHWLLLARVTGIEAGLPPVDVVTLPAWKRTLALSPIGQGPQDGTLVALWREAPGLSGPSSCPSTSEPQSPRSEYSGKWGAAWPLPAAGSMCS